MWREGNSTWLGTEWDQGSTLQPVSDAWYHLSTVLAANTESGPKITSRANQTLSWRLDRGCSHTTTDQIVQLHLMTWTECYAEMWVPNSIPMNECILDHSLFGEQLITYMVRTMAHPWQRESTRHQPLFHTKATHLHNTQLALEFLDLWERHKIVICLGAGILITFLVISIDRIS